jgi:hypothetical protein
MFLKNCLQQWDNVTGVTGYDITIYEQLLTDVGSPFLYQNAQQKGLLSLRICHGETILLGTCPSKGYHDHHRESPSALIPVLARTLGMEPHVEQDNNQVRIRLHKLDDKLFIWILNPTTVQQEVQFGLHERFKGGNPSEVYWEGGQISFSKNKYHGIINPKDVLIFRLQQG